MKAYKHLVVKAAGIALLAGVFAVGAAAKAEATFFAYICDDVACDGVGDVIVADNAAGDTLGGIAGIINISGVSVGGMTVTVNTSQSKPLLGSAASPKMDINFSATGVGTVYIGATDSDFTGLIPFSGMLDGNWSGSGSIDWGFCTNSTNPAGPGLFCAEAPVNEVGITQNPFHRALTLGASPAAPYALIAEIGIHRTTFGTTTGDLLIVPEPASMTLFGLGLIGAGIASRRRRQAR